MSQAPASGKHVTQRAFRTEREFVFRSLAIDNKFRPARVFRRAQGAQSVLFFADYKQQSKIPRSRAEQLLRGTIHSRAASLRIARAAPTYNFGVHRRRK